MPAVRFCAYGAEIKCDCAHHKDCRISVGPFPRRKSVMTSDKSASRH
jgi:hypothetical protein